MKRKTVTDKTKKVSKYMWNYAKMSGLFPDFKDKDKKINKERK